MGRGAGTVAPMFGTWWALFWFAIGAFCALGMVFTRRFIRIFEGWKYVDPDADPSEELVTVRTVQFMLGAIFGVLAGIMALVLQ